MCSSRVPTDLPVYENVEGQLIIQGLFFFFYPKGEELVARGMGLVYGGGTVGLMGVLAHTVPFSTYPHHKNTKQSL